MKPIVIAVLTILLLIFIPLTGSAESPIAYEDQVFNFGHVGIDFKIFHRYHYVNQTDKPVRVLDLDVPCDCSAVTKSDSLAQPGDTLFFSLEFSTRDFYGPTTKSFKVRLDDPKLPEIQFFNLATIGQWFGNLKPSPISLFFLPGKKSQKIMVANRDFKKIRVTNVNVHDTTFTVTPVKETASQNESLELAVTVNPNLKAGTFQSNFTFQIEKTGDDKPSILTIPVKISRY